MIAVASNRYKSLLIAVGILILSLAFYVYTLSPSLGWEDAPKFPTLAYLLRLSALPWQHPFYTLIGYLFTKIPVGDVAYRVNLVSAVFGALTLVVMFNLLKLLFSLEKQVGENIKLLAALGATLSLMVSRTFWFHSVTTEVYIMLSFFTVAIIYCLARFDIEGEIRSLYLGLFLYGLSVSVHFMTVCALPGLFVYLVMMVRKYRGILTPRRIIATCLCFLVGFSLYLGIAIKDFLYINDKVHSPISTINFLTGGRYKANVLHASYPLYYSPLQAIGYHFYDFMIYGTLLGIFGVFRFVVNDIRRFSYISMIYATFLGFAIIYYVSDQSTFYLPALTIFSIFIGYGLLGLLKLSKTRAKTAIIAVASIAFLLISPIIVYHSLPNYIAKLGKEQREKWEERVVFNYGRRSNWELQAKWQQEGRGVLIKHFLNPNQRGDFTAREYGKSILDSLPPNSLFVTGGLYDWYAYALIDYLKVVENRRPDVTHIYWDWYFPNDELRYRIMVGAIQSNIGQRPIFVSAPFRNTLRSTLPSYRFVPYGLVYQIMKT
jgi:hypothetical protein